MCTQTTHSRTWAYAWVEDAGRACHWKEPVSSPGTGKRHWVSSAMDCFRCRTHFVAQSGFRIQFAFSRLPSAKHLTVCSLFVAAVRSAERHHRQTHGSKLSLRPLPGNLHVLDRPGWSVVHNSQDVKQGKCLTACPAASTQVLAPLYTRPTTSECELLDANCC